MLKYLTRVTFTTFCSCPMKQLTFHKTRYHVTTWVNELNKTRITNLQMSVADCVNHGDKSPKSRGC